MDEAKNVVGVIVFVFDDFLNVGTLPTWFGCLSTTANNSIPSGHGSGV